MIIRVMKKWFRKKTIKLNLVKRSSTGTPAEIRLTVYRRCEMARGVVQWSCMLAQGNPGAVGFSPQRALRQKVSLASENRFLDFFRYSFRFRLSRGRPQQLFVP